MLSIILNGTVQITKKQKNRYNQKISNQNPLLALRGYRVHILRTDYYINTPFTHILHASIDVRIIRAFGVRV